METRAGFAYKGRSGGPARRSLSRSVRPAVSALLACSAAAGPGAAPAPLGLTRAARCPDPCAAAKRDYEVKVAENGEPGRGNDQFSIGVSKGSVTIYTAGAWSGDGPIRGGNIKLHKGNKSNTPPPGFTCRESGGSTGGSPPPTTTRVKNDNPAVACTGTGVSWIGFKAP